MPQHCGGLWNCASSRHLLLLGNLSGTICWDSEVGKATPSGFTKPAHQHFDMLMGVLFLSRAWQRLRHSPETTTLKSNSIQSQPTNNQSKIIFSPLKNRCRREVEEEEDEKLNVGRRWEGRGLNRFRWRKGRGRFYVWRSKTSFSPSEQCKKQTKIEKPFFASFHTIRLLAFFLCLILRAAEKERERETRLPSILNKKKQHFKNWAPPPLHPTTTTTKTKWFTYLYKHYM